LFHCGTDTLPQPQIDACLSDLAAAIASLSGYCCTKR